MSVSKIKGLIATLSIAIGLAIIMFFMKFSEKKNNSRFARTWCRIFFPFNRFELEIFGAFDEEADLLMLNHQSAVDIIFLEGLHPRNLCWIAKKQLGEIPFYGYALKGPKMILIDREDRASLIYIFKEAKTALSQGRPLVIFPEGTRCKDESQFLPFKNGAKMIAEKLKLRVQPIVLVNSSRIYNSSPMESRGSKARIVALKSFIPSEVGEDWYERLEVQMQEVYHKHFNELNH
ncbi:lysophospholipid acyltransferase family protein [Helicobacter kayseriensis]|uniref:lysophospholipid acyltransferase family protein n=1 Tax=Helicobacter kayseriensis TaxID=2905877 RepID=UPI001E3B1F9A|nr:lysophospholipid acyltransferase family protein [Helicobacter kayseriensis]MCE3046693.1 1-acyl-sn-glycerol-3-phosphate acyltransferase [Helicobacter kayseriensis]MCE3048005.1 1-acyl-sn-glycerol-3-phosphate acyltransferase [Helicobacter kayseriensis]